MSNKPYETIYKIPFIEAEYMRWKESRTKNRMKAALIITNAAWLCLTALIVVQRYEKRR
jgi:hypothetical protein